MRKILVRFSFIGRSYYGTQKQPEGKTIQGDFEEALTRLFREPTKVTLASRLDRYVSAADFAVSFHMPDSVSITIDHLGYYLTRFLGQDIRLTTLVEIPEDFNPRYQCSYKSYVYLIQNREDYNPLLNPITYVPTKVLNANRLKEALALLQGHHDFRYLSSPEGEENTILDLDKTSLTERDGLLVIRFIGKSFLRYQVRFMVGLALRYEQGYLTLDDIRSVLDGNDVKYPRLKAEPQGLILEKICYPDLHDEEAYPEGMPRFLKL